MNTPGKTLSFLPFLFAALLFGGCASQPAKDRPEIGCVQCGEIIDIRPATSSGTAGMAPAGAAPSARILQPTRSLGVNTPGVPSIGSGLSPRTGDVPVYRVDNMSRLSSRAEVVLRMDTGAVESLLVEDAYTLRIGERVRRVGNRLMPEAAPAEAP